MNDSMSQKAKVFFANQCEQLFRAGRFILEKLPIDVLTSIIQVLEIHKSEYIAALSTFRALLLRRIEIEFHSDQGSNLERIYYKMLSQGKDRKEVNLFKEWFSKLMRLKSFSFTVYEPDNFFVFNEEFKADKITESMRINRREAEKLINKDLKTFTLLMLELIPQGRVKLFQMRLDHLRILLEGILKHTNEKARAQQVSITIAYKRQNRLNLSAKELHDNRMYLEERYNYLVEQNPNLEGAKEWIKQFKVLEFNYPHDFRDHYFIRGDVLELFQQKQRSAESENETSSLLT